MKERPDPIPHEVTELIREVLMLHRAEFDDDFSGLLLQLDGIAYSLGEAIASTLRLQQSLRRIRQKQAAKEAA